jgi:chromate transport protein ChrA
MGEEATPGSGASKMDAWMGWKASRKISGWSRVILGILPQGRII